MNISAYFPAEVKSSLRMVQAKTGSNVKGRLAEALRDLFRKHNVPVSVGAGRRSIGMASAKEGLPVTPAVVQWARERSGYTIEDAKRYFKKIVAWETGQALPTYVQVEDMAERFKIPVAVFFFPKPPEVPPIEKSFRTLTAKDFAAIPRRVRFFCVRARRCSSTSPS